ncbi:response regulator [Paenibacillus sp. MSJ-34]|uniref:response regulator transcription factor n=1 Tax=Paenibacillus sp. MSJ-34 TaxID=2841529 RepID=UPI001C10C00C|nr:response regulator [Paenibacillus sp. MSJ-34]MBU5445265.1 response regulator [Paenibacillus sp. MSJ-34]
MYKVLIVDDEPKVRNGLTKLIPAIDPEWSVVGQAKNGLEALEMVKRNMPDLVITDIRMPNMNGLDLLNVLKEYPLHVVILSGYGYFEYAKTAIRFGAFDYLLKPLKPDEVKDLLGRLKTEIRTPRTMPSAITSDFQYSKLWKDWLLGVEDAEEYMERLRGRLPADASAYRIIAVEIDDFEELVTEDQWGDRQLVLFAVRNIAYEILKGQPDLACFFLFAGGSHIYFLLVNEPCPQHVYESMIYEVRRWVKISISVGISGETKRFEQLTAVFAGAKEALLNKWIYGNGKVHDYNDLFFNGQRQSGYPSDLDTALIVSIREGQTGKAEELLKQFIESILKQNVTYQVFHKYCLQLLSSVVRFIYEKKIAGLVFQDAMKPYDLFHENFSADDYMKFMTKLIEASVSSAEWKKQQKHNRTLETAVGFIHQHYMKDLSLDDVSGHVRMSGSYFSSFFKQEMGMTFVEYVTQYRMDKAKVLMMDPDLKLYSIAQMVGYQDVKYFSRLFKKTEGVTPGEYRQFFYRKEEEDEK